ncbi:MAG TPA: biosynthetic peptidoglycan transglycosylase, partial [Rhodanobacteraceae bacterium]|nr:biosynthetic peptidoglycan transglycosylase [Rhodanobacteraceae bacterium]
MKRISRHCAAGAPLVAVWLGASLAHLTQLDLRELPATLTFTTEAAGGIEIERAGDGGWRGVQVLDRRGEPLNATFTNGWNLHDAVPLHDIPAFLRTAFVTAEDKRFFEHHGPDWRARLAAAWTNVKSGRAVRGASTISEQVVGMLHPRPRSVWSRWLEGFEARELERRFTKNEILELYLNQVPYASNRRGVRQAASYYF